MPSVNDPRHASVIQEAQAIFRNGGWLLADAGYEHVYTGEFKTALAQCDAVSAHLIRTRADRIALHPTTGRIVWYDAKTTSWKKGQDFPVEALPFLKACCDAETLGIVYIFCCRRNDGTEYGLQAGAKSAQMIQRILIPAWRRGDDTERWKLAFRRMLTTLQCDPTIMSGNCTKGGGDPYVALYLDNAELPTWQDVILKLVV